MFLYIVIDRKPFLPTRSMWPLPLTPKSIGFIYLSWAIIIPRPKRSLLITNLVYLQINRGHLLVMSNQSFPRPMHSLVIDRKPFLPTMSMWPWPLTLWPQNKKVVIYWSWAIIIPSWKFLGLNILYYSSETVFTYKVNMTLTSDPLAQRGHLLVKSNL